MKTWKSRIEALEKLAGSPEELAVQIGVSYATIYRWKQGKSTPSPLAQSKIASMEKRVGKVAVK